MNPLKELFEYEEWATRKLFAVALSLPEMPERVSVLGSHILAAHRIWISRIKEETSPLSVWETISPAKWNYWLDRNMDDFGDLLLELKPGQVVAYHNTKGESFRNSAEEILQHLLLHGAYHRGQIAQLLRPLVDELPYTDYIFFARRNAD